jgi:hypothetical protein
MNVFERFEQLGKFFGVAGSALLLLSVFYDFSFLASLGLSFAEIPTTISDHVRSAIVWVPPVGGMALVLYMYEMFMRRVEGGRTKEELIASFPRPRFMRAFRASADALVPIGGALAFLAWLVFGTSYGGLYLGFIMLWGFLSLSIVQHPKMGKGFSQSTARLFIMVPIVIAIVGSFGYWHGQRLLSSNVAAWEVLIKRGEDTEKRQLVGMRRFETVVVTVDPHKGVAVLPAGSVVAANVIATANSDSPNSCRWFGIFCRSVPANASGK